MSPYNYAVNNPISFFDIFGAEADGGNAASKYNPQYAPDPRPAFQDPNLPGTTSSAPANPDHDIFSGPNYDTDGNFTNSGAKKASPGTLSKPSLGNDAYDPNDWFRENKYNIPILGSDLKSNDAAREGKLGEALLHRINWTIEILAVTQAFFEIGMTTGRSSGRNGKGTLTKTSNNILSQEIKTSAQIEFTYTKSAGKHLFETIIHGEYSGMLSRPYMNSQLFIREIMQTGPGVMDASYPGGYNWRVPGNFRGSQGIFELGVNPETNVIYHFNFNGK